MSLKKGNSIQQDIEKKSSGSADDRKRMLPSLSALRAFEAAARYRSFSRAAEELNVTTSAISHQLRTLEDWLNVPLFVRNSRPIKLTEAGIAYSRDLALAFDQIVKTTAELLSSSGREMLTVSTMDSFATNWLVPRLSRFREENSWLDVRVTTSDRFVDFDREGVDIAIRYGSGQWRGTTSELLFEDNVLVVCSSKLLGSVGKAFRPELYTLIHDGSTPGWAEWFQAERQLDLMNLTSGIYFNHTYLALQAAMNGDGIALASEPLVRDLIEYGHLISPTTVKLQGFGAYYFVTTTARTNIQKVQVFRDWLMAERFASLGRDEPKIQSSKA